MIKNFKSELDLISSNDRISEKLMILALYNEFYNSILGAIDDRFIEHYATFMETTFASVASSQNSQEKKNVNAEQFMGIYLRKILRNAKMSSFPPVKSTITTFEKQLNDIISISNYVNIIDQFESIPLESKVSIMAHFREYINNMFLTIIEFIGEENSKELRHNILDMLSTRLEEYLKDCLNQGIAPNNLTDNLKFVMMVFTKNYLMKKLNDGEFGFENVQNEYYREFLASSSETEQKVFTIVSVYVIAGYDINDKKTKKTMIKETCESLGISKAQLIKIVISIGIWYLKLWAREVHGMVTEISDDDFPKKTKK